MKVFYNVNKVIATRLSRRIRAQVPGVVQSGVAAKTKAYGVMEGKTHVDFPRAAGGPQEHIARRSGLAVLQPHPRRDSLDRGHPPSPHPPPNNVPAFEAGAAATGTNNSNALGVVGSWVGLASSHV